MTKRTTVVLPDSVENAIETMVRESYKSEEIPDLSQSEAIRQLLQVGIENSELVDLVPEHEMVALRRDQIKRENKLRDWRAGFKTRVKRQFTRRFKNGYNPAELAEFAIGMREEARALWWDDDNEDHVERRREAIDYVDRVVDQAREDYETSTHDPLDVDSLFSSFSGVEDGEQADRLEGVDLDGEVRDLVKDMKRRGMEPDPNGLATRIANEHDLEESLARSVVDDVLEEGVSAHV